MKADKKDILKKVLMLAEEDKPAADFTQNVMQFIEAEAKTEIALKSLLQQEEAVGPAFNFTANVMAQITANQQASVYKPIITKRVWYGIAAMMAVFLLLIFASNQSTQNTAHKNQIVDVINYTHTIPPLYLMAMVVITILLFADYLINQLKNKPVSQ